MKAALYHRVSTLDQNPELARGELRAAAAARGASVVLDVEETGSGAKNNRPGLARVMEAARAGRIDAVLVWKLDRFGRSTIDLLTNVQELESCGVRFVATSQGLDVGGRDGSGAMGRMILTVMAGMAEFERELIRERTTLGIANAKAKGTKSGKPIGRRPAAVSAPVLEHAARLRRHPAHDGVPMSWRAIRKALAAMDVQNLPDQATLQKLCYKTYPDLPRGKARGRAGRGPGRRDVKNRTV